MNRIAGAEDFAQAALTGNKKIDVLINNAGLIKSPTVGTEASRDIVIHVKSIAPYTHAQKTARKWTGEASS